MRLNKTFTKLIVWVLICCIGTGGVFLRANAGELLSPGGNTSDTLTVTEPSEEGSVEPSEEGSEEPSEEGSEEPSEEGSEEPSEEGSEEPSEEVSEEPSEEGSEEPSEEVSVEPSEEVSEEPSEEDNETVDEDELIVSDNYVVSPEAQRDLQQIVAERPILALIYRQEECDIYSTPSFEGEVADTLTSGQQIQIQDAVYDEYGSVWEYVLYYKDDTAHYGYVYRNAFISSDERFLQWEDQYGMNPPLLMRSFAYGPMANTDPLIEKFPESYREALYALKEAHPNWQFVKMETNLDWNTVVANEMESGRSLIHTSMPSYLQNGIYGPKWAYATQGALEYYLDPRNGLTESGIFEFEQLTYNESYHKIDALRTFLSTTFMSGLIPGDAKFPEYVITYADLIQGTGKDWGVSPFHLASRLYQEQGAGNSPLISGSYPGYEGYYNYFNIGATGSGEDVIINGLTRAKKEGWDNRYDSIFYGARYISLNYILEGQDTLYLQKFDVDDSNNGLYYHQYMQNIGAPLSEAKNIMKLYKNAGSLDNTFVFKIPVYNNMPATACALPTVSYQILLTPPEGYTGTEVYLDGIAYSAVAQGGQLSIAAPDGTAKTVTMYQYNEAGVPIGMYVWTLQHTGLIYTVTPQPNLRDLLTYHGFSIRITGKSGIRFKTGVSVTTRNQLTSSGINGFVLKEYGTLVMNQANRSTYAFIKGANKVKSGVSYGIDETGNHVDKVYETINDRYRYTSVLIGLPAEQYKTEFAFRGYMILTQNGTDTVIYGPPVYKSIYTLAGQALATGQYAEDSDAAIFLNQLIIDADAATVSSGN